MNRLGLLGMASVLGMLMAMSASVLAHNVIGAVYVIGEDIEGEIGFSDGDMAPQGTTVVVRNSTNDEVFAELVTDAEGYFSFRPNVGVRHTFYANLGSGHVFDTELPRDELPAHLLTGEDRETLQRSQYSSVAADTHEGAANRDLDAMIQKALARQIKPLRQSLQRYQEKASLQDILGGIGYIFGLCGIAIWLKQRDLQAKKVSQTNETNS